MKQETQKTSKIRKGLVGLVMLGVAGLGGCVSSGYSNRSDYSNMKRDKATEYKVAEEILRLKAEEVGGKRGVKGHALANMFGFWAWRAGQADAYNNPERNNSDADDLRVRKKENSRQIYSWKIIDLDTGKSETLLEIHNPYKTEPRDKALDYFCDKVKNRDFSKKGYLVIWRDENINYEVSYYTPKGIIVDDEVILFNEKGEKVFSRKIDKK